MHDLQYSFQEKSLLGILKCIPHGLFSGWIFHSSHAGDKNFHHKFSMGSRVIFRV